MYMSNIVVTILAAGDGKRMKSDIPKVLHLFKGKPMLISILQTALLLNPGTIIIVTGKHDPLIRDTIKKYFDINMFVFQKQQVPMGTGEAIKSCLPLYRDDSRVLILNGDAPLITKDILEKFIINSDRVNILVAKFLNPSGYGRIIHDSLGRFTAIMEERDCSEDDRKINIINSGIYLIEGKLLKKYIPMINNSNSQKEYYLTDVVSLIKQNTYMSINTHLVGEEENKYIAGVNTPDELYKLELIDQG
jgi:UDP-N-acetylglucosamine diphosphorylase/glucosamine-1-phosphate N-acetyltransferase